MLDPVNLSGMTMLSRHSVEIYQGNGLTCNSSGNIWQQSSQLAEPLWTDHGLKRGIVHKLISTLKSTGWEQFIETTPITLTGEEKAIGIP